MKRKGYKMRCLIICVIVLALLMAGCSQADLERTSEDMKAFLSERMAELAEEKGDGTEESSSKKKSAGTGAADTEEGAVHQEAAGEAEEAAGNERARVSAEQASEYADNFVYQTLDEETKQVYHEVLTAALAHTEKVAVSTLDIDLLERAYKAVCADYGGLFWMSGYVYTQYTRGGKLISMDFSPKYTMDYEERMQIQQQIDASAAELLAGIGMQDSEYEKAKYVFEILVQNVDYDTRAENNQNIISVFLNRATVCQGYACATQYLLRNLGMQSAIVTGIANGEAHAWNLVRINGNYYYMDTTWGNSRYLDGTSQVEKYVNYNYLAVTTEEIIRTHRIDTAFPLPECTSMEDTYFIRENKYFTEWNPEAIGSLLRETWDAGGGDVAVKFAAPELYGQAVQYFITEQHITDYCANISSIYYLEDQELYILTFNL